MAEGAVTGYYRVQPTDQNVLSGQVEEQKTLREVGLVKKDLDIAIKPPRGRHGGW